MDQHSTPRRRTPLPRGQRRLLPRRIAGVGAISPHGKSVAALWSNLLQGRAAFSPLTFFDASVFRNPLAGVVEGYPNSNDPAQPARAIRMLDDAVGESLRDALGLAAD